MHVNSVYLASLENSGISHRSSLVLPIDFSDVLEHVYHELLYLNENHSQIFVKDSLAPERPVHIGIKTDINKTSKFKIM